MFVFICVSKTVSQQIDISRQGAEAVKIRVFSETAGAVSLEASTNFQSWNAVASTNGASLELTDSNLYAFPHRFFRASFGAQTNTVSLQILSPPNDAVVTTNRPVIEVAYSGIAAATSNLVLRMRGTNLPTRVNLTGDRAVFELLSPLPEGFATIHAAYLGTNIFTEAVARVDLNIRTTGSNLPPLAQFDFRSTPAATPVTIPVLANDKDPNGDPLSISGFTQGTNGTVSLQNGALQYTPGPNFVGNDRFTYTVADPTGASATGEVRIAVMAPAGPIAYVVDAPVLANEFREIPEAIAYVCNASQQPGKVIIRTDRLLAISELRINCPVEISREDDRHSSLSGGAVRIISEANVTLAGMNIAADDILFDARANLNLFRVALTGPTLIRLRDDGIAAVTFNAAAPAAPQNLQVVDVTAPSVTTSIEAPGEVHADLEGIRAKVVGIEGEVDLGSVEYKAVESENVTVELTVGASARVAAQAVAAASRHHMDVTVNGQAEVLMESVVAAHGEIDMKGAGKVTIDVSNTQSQTSVRKFNGEDTSYRSRDHTAFDAEYVVGNENASAKVRITENSLRAGGTVRQTIAPGAEAEVTVDVAHVDGETVVTSEGKLTAQYKGAEFNAGYRARINAGEASIDTRDGSARGVDIDVEAGVHVQNLIMNNMDFKANVNANFREGAFLGVGGALNSDFSLGSRLTVILSSPPGGLPNKKKPGLANAATPSEFVVTNCAFNVTGNQAPIHVSGLEIPVRIERNTIRAPSFGIVAGEIAAPLTIRSNTLINCGIGIDGDIEGEGRSGYAPGPYLISGNTIREGNPNEGITIQDVKLAIVELNDIAATNGLTVSAAYAQVVSNMFDASRNGAMAIRALKGPNGAAVLIVTGNTITGAAPIVLLPDSYSRFESNRFISVIPQGSEDPDPVSVLSVGNSQGTVSAVFRKNQFSDLTISALGAAFLEVSENTGTFKEIGFFSLPPNSRTIAAVINNNTLSGDFPRISADGVSLRMRGNRIDDLDLGISGNFAPNYAVVENNQFGGASNVSVGENGHTRLAGNTFGSDSFIGDGGFLVNDPGTNAINNDNISSPLNFNGDADGCADYPPPEFTGDPNDPCSNGMGPRPPSAPNIPEPVEPPWPVF